MTLDENQTREKADSSSHRPMVVVLTGGIASGKSTVSRRFAELGVPVVDTDVIARRLVEAGSPVLDEIADTFGNGFIRLDGSLDRSLLRERVFSDEHARKLLEAILHPRIQAVVEESIAALSFYYCIVVVPLYAETKGFIQPDRVLVVDAREEQQIRRLVERDGITPSLARAMLESQATRQVRLAAATDVIENDGAPEALEHQVRRIHDAYMALAAPATASNGHRI